MKVQIDIIKMFWVGKSRPVSTILFFGNFVHIFAPLHLFHHRVKDFSIRSIDWRPTGYGCWWWGWLSYSVLNIWICCWSGKTRAASPAMEPRRPPMLTRIRLKLALKASVQQLDCKSFQPDRQVHVDRCMHFQKSKHILRSEVGWCDQTQLLLKACRPTPTSICKLGGIWSKRNHFRGQSSCSRYTWTYWMLIDCHLQILHGDLERSFDHHGKRNWQKSLKMK